MLADFVNCYMQLLTLQMPLCQGITAKECTSATYLKTQLSTSATARTSTKEVSVPTLTKSYSSLN